MNKFTHSGDLFAENSAQYDDYCDHLVNNWDEFDAEICAYADMLNLRADPDAFVAKQKAKLAVNSRAGSRRVRNPVRSSTKLTIADAMCLVGKTLAHRWPAATVA